MTDEDPRLAITTRVYASQEPTLDQEATLVRRFAEDGRSSLLGWLAIAAESVRAVNYLTSSTDPIPAPVVYEVLGELAPVASRLPQACQQLGDGLQRSLEQHALYEANGGDPRESVILARSWLEQAAAAAAELGRALNAAQAAIANQGLAD